MLNSYRVAILLMILFGVAGIQAARYQDHIPSAACKRPLPAEESIANNDSATLATASMAATKQASSSAASLAVKTISIDTHAR